MIVARRQPSPSPLRRQMTSVPEQSNLEYREEGSDSNKEDLGGDDDDSTPYLHEESWQHDDVDTTSNPIDFDSDEMAEWRIDTSQSSWDTPVKSLLADVEDKEADDDVAHILSLEVSSL